MQTSTAQALVQYDEEGEEEAGEFAGDDGRDPLDSDLLHLRTSIRANVRLDCRLCTLPGRCLEGVIVINFQYTFRWAFSSHAV